ncbi:MAG: DUF4351 domain-containing protein [Candidatus Competibacterales bacterium]
MCRPLTRVLCRRFDELSPEVEQRLAKANADELEAWHERLFDVDTLGAVFEASGSQTNWSPG